MITTASIHGFTPYIYPPCQVAQIANCLYKIKTEDKVERKPNASIQRVITPLKLNKYKIDIYA